MRKRLQFLLVMITLVIVAVSAYALGNRITLDSDQPMDNQIVAFKAWYYDLSLVDQAKWDIAFDDLTDPDNMQSIEASPSFLFFNAQENPGKGLVVYYLPNGKVYHTDPKCQYIRTKDNVQLVHLSELSEDIKICKRCEGD